MTKVTRARTLVRAGRWLVLASFVLPMSLSASSGPGAWARLALYINDNLIEPIEKTLDWQSWALDKMIAARTGEPGPANPGGFSGGQFSDQLIQDRRNVEALPVPAFSADLPEVPASLPNGYDAVRALLRAQVNKANEAFYEVREADEGVRSLDSYKLRVDAQARGITHLASAINSILENAPWIDVSHQLKFDWVAFHLEYPALNSAIASAVSDKRRAIINLKQARITQLRASTQRLRSALGTEAALLQEDAKKLYERGVAINNRETDALEARDVALEEKDQEIESHQYQMRQLQDQIQDLYNQSTALRNQATPLRREINRYVEERHGHYNYCPNRNNWQTCDHSELKARWDNESRQSSYVTGRESRIKELERRARALEDRATALNQERNQYQQQINALNQLKAAINKKYQQDMLPIQADRRKLIEDQWKSRANVHSAESAADLARIDQLMGSLAGGAP